MSEQPRVGSTACGRCGKDPAEGVAFIGNTRYCHDEFSSAPTCYMVLDLRRHLDQLDTRAFNLRMALLAAREFITCHPAVQGEWPLLVQVIDKALGR